MPTDIIAILTVYKRPEYLDEQITSICNQTIPPKEIWVWSNGNNIFKIDSKKYPVPIRLFYSSHNMKYHGRFAVGLLAQCEYLAIFDDDTIPGPRWFENCLGCEEEGYSGIFGGVGILLRDRIYANGIRYGWAYPSPYTIEVDLLGHAWFFKKEYLKYMWYEEPFSYDNGEDIQFGFLAKKYGGISSWCPPHPADDKEVWSSLKAWEYGTDSKASSNGSLMPIPEFYRQRDECINYAIDNGWKTVLRVP